MSYTKEELETAKHRYELFIDDKNYCFQDFNFDQSSFVYKLIKLNNLLLKYEISTISIPSRIVNSAIDIDENIQETLIDYNVCKGLECDFYTTGEFCSMSCYTEYRRYVSMRTFNHIQNGDYDKQLKEHGIEL